MRKIKILIGLGVLTAVMPYLGFPFALKNLIVTLCGLGVLYVSFTMYRKDRKEEKETFENFSENNDFVEANILDRSAL